MSQVWKDNNDIAFLGQVFSSTGIANGRATQPVEISSKVFWIQLYFIVLIMGREQNIQLLLASSLSPKLARILRDMSDIVRFILVQLWWLELIMFLFGFGTRQKFEDEYISWVSRNMNPRKYVDAVHTSFATLNLTGGLHCFRYIEVSVSFMLFCLFFIYNMLAQTPPRMFRIWLHNTIQIYNCMLSVSENRTGKWTLTR